MRVDWWITRPTSGAAAGRHHPARPVTVEAEPNDDVRKGNEATMPGALCGAIGQPGDIDHFSFDCKKGQKYFVRVFARGTLRSPLDSVINVFDPNFRSIAGNDDEGRNPDSFVEFTPAEKTFDRFMALADLLEDTLEHPVEVVTTESLSPFIGPHILAEARDVLRAA
jgi:predicted nucleotidyltransferase